MPDVQELIAEIARRNGLRVEHGDPLFAVGTICEAYLEETIQTFDDRIAERLADFEIAVRKIQTRAGQLIAAEFNDRVASIRAELENDIAAAGIQAVEIVHRVEQANRRPVMLRWAALGILGAILMFAAGLWTGVHYH